MTELTYNVEVPAIERKHAKTLKASNQCTLVSRIATAWQKKREHSADLKQSQMALTILNRNSNELRYERHICIALMHQ